MRGHLANAEPRTCPICGEDFTPLRKAQQFCSPPKRCRYTNRARILAASVSNYDSIGTSATCTRCGTSFTIKRLRQKICGPSCPGRPDTTRTCGNPACGQPFTVLGGSRGKGNQRFCSASCRDVISRIRLEERFRKYGLTQDEYLAKARKQNNQCAICGTVPAPDKRRTRPNGLPYLEVDHCHESGKTRDLLCGHCNKGIGHFFDDPALLALAALYVRRWNEQLLLTRRQPAGPR